MRKLLLNRAPYHRGQSKIGVSKGHALITHMIEICHQNVFDRSMTTINDIFDPEELKKYITEETNKTLSHYKDGDLLINIGGDHSISMGTIPPILQLYPETKILWIDAHADINSPQSSHTGNIHGMPVHFLLRDDIGPDRLFYYGIRDLDPYEIETVVNSKIKYIPSPSVNSNSHDEIRKWVGDNPVHVSLDLDGLDPSFAPCTGTPVPGGLDLDETVDLIESLNQNMVSIDLVEFNPMLGSHEDVGKTMDSIKRIVEIL